MTEQKKLDSQLETAEKIAPNVEKSADTVENPDKNPHELSQDELEAVSGGGLGDDLAEVISKAICGESEVFAIKLARRATEKN